MRALLSIGVLGASLLAAGAVWSQASAVPPPAPTAAAPLTRSLPARSNRHALVIGVGRYADPAIESLPGTAIDRVSATQMAQAMEVPLAQIRYLQDEQATGDAIRRALRELDERVQVGDRVFIHFSGHGTRFRDAAAGGCVEALLAHDGGASGTLTNREMAQLLQGITRKTDKLFVMYDACHSGGVIAPDTAGRTRGMDAAGRLRPKFSAPADECSRPVNVRTRSLLAEAADRGALPQDIIHLSSARDNEVSFDDEQRGGLATQFMRDCLLREARDADGSGAISIDEVRACAQERIDRRLRNDPNFQAHHLTLTGNAAFVPAWFSKEQLQPVAAAAAAPPAALTGAQALRQLFDQRDAKRQVRVKAVREQLRIGQDTLEFAVQSDRPGYLYIAMAGSDNRTLQLLFPNDLDTDNRIEAGRTLELPRPHWRVRAGGPPGGNELLVIVADGPRDLSPLAGSKAGPFVYSLNDAAGRATLGALLSHSRAGADAFGAALLQIQEIR